MKKISYTFTIILILIISTVLWLAEEIVSYVRNNQKDHLNYEICDDLEFSDLLLIIDKQDTIINHLLERNELVTIKYTRSHGKNVFSLRHDDHSHRITGFSKTDIWKASKTEIKICGMEVSWKVNNEGEESEGKELVFCQRDSVINYYNSFFYSDIDFDILSKFQSNAVLEIPSELTGNQKEVILGYQKVDSVISFVQLIAHDSLFEKNADPVRNHILLKSKQTAFRYTISSLEANDFDFIKKENNNYIFSYYSSPAGYTIFYIIIGDQIFKTRQLGEGYIIKPDEPLLDGDSIFIYNEFSRLKKFPLKEIGWSYVANIR